MAMRWSIGLEQKWQKIRDNFAPARIITKRTFIEVEEKDATPKGVRRSVMSFPMMTHDQVKWEAVIAGQRVADPCDDQSTGEGAASFVETAITEDCADINDPGGGAASSKEQVAFEVTNASTVDEGCDCADGGDCASQDDLDRSWAAANGEGWNEGPSDDGSSGEPPSPAMPQHPRAPVLHICLEATYVDEAASPALLTSLDWMDGRLPRDMEKQMLKRGAVARAEAMSVDGVALTTVCDCARTTIKIGNLPKNCTRDIVMQTLDVEGFAGKYRFLYLPMDLNSQTCQGYAFVDFANHETAKAAMDHFHGSSTMNSAHEEQACETVWSHPLQGYEAHVCRFRNSPMMHESVPDSARPMVFDGGHQIPFPSPTKRLRRPRTKRPGIVAAGETET